MVVFGLVSPLGGGTLVQVGLILTQDRAAVCILVKVLCGQDYLGKCMKMFLYDQNHSIEQPLSLRYHCSYELNLVLGSISNPASGTWTRGEQIKKETEVLFFFSSFHWTALSHDSPALPYWVGPDCEWEELESWQADK